MYTIDRLFYVIAVCFIRDIKFLLMNSIAQKAIKKLMSYSMLISSDSISTENNRSLYFKIIFS